MGLARVSHNNSYRVPGAPVREPYIAQNIRGGWLFSTLRQTGLIDVENRADLTHRLPPVEIFRRTQGPMLISGILDQLFQNHREEIVTFLAGNGELRVLLLHPQRAGDSLENMWVRHQEEWVSYWQTNCNEAQVALDAIIDAGLDKMQGFHLRFLTEIPPFFGMLSGWPSESTDRWQRGSFVRIQPLTFSRFVGRGSVITFELINNVRHSPFAYYAEDMMEQWRTATEDADLVEKRRKALRQAQYLEQ
jgi:hypothetical protein